MAQLPSNIDIDINYNIIRERPTFSNKAALRDLLISSSTSSILYAQCMKMNNDIWNPIDSSQLSYKGNVEVDGLVSKLSSKKEQHVQNEVLALKTTSKPQGENVFINNLNTSLPQNIFNIQLLYNIN